MTDEPLSRGERTRADILNAAHKLFLDYGFHGTSMRQIALGADIALGGIYNHFANKDKIFVATLMAHHPIHEVIPAMSAAQGDNVDELIRDAAHRMVSAINHQPDFLNLMFIELVEFKGQHIPDLVQTFFPQAVSFAQRLLEKNDQLRPIPIPVLMRAFIGLFFSYVMTDLLLGSPTLPELQQENTLDHFVDIFLHGIIKNTSSDGAV